MSQCSESLRVLFGFVRFLHLVASTGFAGVPARNPTCRAPNRRAGPAVMKPETPHEMGLGMSFTLSIHMASFQDKSPRFVPKVCYSPYSPFQGNSFHVSGHTSGLMLECFAWPLAKFPEQAGTTGTPCFRVSDVVLCKFPTCNSLLVHCGDCFDHIPDPFSFTFNLWIVKC